MTPLITPGDIRMYALAGRARSDDQSALLLFVAATVIAVLLIAVTLIVAIPRATRKRDAAWRMIAERLGLRFTPGGSGLMHLSASMEGVVDGRTVRVDTLSTGRRHFTRVRAAATGRSVLDGRVGPLEALGARQVSLAHDGPDVSLSWLGYETDLGAVHTACGIVAAASRGDR